MTAQVTATVHDESSLDLVELRWRQPGGRLHQVPMRFDASSNRWEAEIGPVSGLGDIHWWVVAQDRWGWERSSPIQVLPVDEMCLI